MALATTPFATVRLAKAADAGGILDCLRAAFDPYSARYTPDAFADTTLTPDALKRRLMTMAVAVACAGPGTIVGTVAWSLGALDGGHLRGMAVLPDCHGRGIGSALLLAAETELRIRGARRISLDTTAPLEAAIRFYTKHGFAPTGRVRDFFGMTLFEYDKSLE